MEKILYGKNLSCATKIILPPCKNHACHMQHRWRSNYVSYSYFVQQSVMDPSDHNMDSSKNDNDTNSEATLT